MMRESFIGHHWDANKHFSIVPFKRSNRSHGLKNRCDLRFGAPLPRGNLQPSTGSNPFRTATA